MSLRVALIADIHGNLSALDAVIADLDTQQVDAHVLMGDYFLFGPDPRGVADRLRELGWPAIEGNTDRYIVDADPDHVFAPMIRWYREQLGEDHLAWMKERPFSQREDSLLCVHANPLDLESLLISEQDEWDTYKLSNEEEAARLLDGVDAALTVYGHIHYFSRGTLAGCEVASIGAVGMPFDGDQRAAYAIATLGDDEWTLEPRRSAYDYESVAQQIRDQGTQLAEGRALRLLEARAVPLRTH